MESAVKKFFSSPVFAVAGASQDTRKYGYKVLEWYHERSLPVTPVNPRTPHITVGTHTYKSVPLASALSSPATTSLSIITPPPVTLQVLREAKEAGVAAVWMQPGSFDAEGLAFAKKNFEGAAVGGKGGRGGEGWCVLVDGDRGLKQANRETGKEVRGFPL
ncbi:MAG: NAD(P)-binding domain [Lasallia pustulata]|uniref:NAD(P)-binding domain n=1 Tax=Lasallia pustulata TaxID=136370 RepID=A0A5M8PZ53_9LECA|nr:MAG: NAD(P)-binding domain [Lasallia pustulata]